MHFLDAQASGLATLSLTVVIGLVLGAVRFRGLRLGISGVLFSGLLFGQLQMASTPEVRGVLAFLQDFALILFVYTIGLQVGPGFVSSLKAEGLRLNLLAVAALVLGALMTVGVVAGTHMTDKARAPGLYSGAFTTTAGLAAGQEALKSRGIADGARAAGLAYAVTYPFGLVGPVLVIVLFRRLFRVNLADELESHAAAQQARRPPRTYADIEVTNPEIADTALRDMGFARDNNIIFARLLRDGAASVPKADTRIKVGDVFRAVGPRPVLDDLIALMGRASAADFDQVKGDVRRMDIVVTRTAVLGKPLRELDLTNRHGVTIARVTRAGVDLTPRASTTLHFGDSVTVVGPEARLKAVEAELGNSVDELNRPQLIPIFLGIVLGVIVGSIPLAIPGTGTGVKIGLAGGPMLVAIVLSRLGNIGKVVWYMPAASNQLFRDFGMAVFLACVGLQQGDGFMQKLLSGGGLSLMAWGAAVTVVPVFLVGIVARMAFKMNFVTLAGWVAGTMTSSPALLFAGEMTNSDAPALTYAAVAPLAMIVPIICCEILAAAK